MINHKHLDTLLELKQNSSINQRSLARKLNISLGPYQCHHKKPNLPWLD
jgi:hypothetical protein